MEAPLVFAGYGATAEEFHYDDYAGIDVKDKIVVVLRYEPSGFAERAATMASPSIRSSSPKPSTPAIMEQSGIVLNGKLGDGEEDLLTRFGSVSGPENVGHGNGAGQECRRGLLVSVRRENP